MIPENKIDPRIVRTRKLLIESFTKLTLKKDFKDITIQDITDEATVNRATFYSHFEDKYELMEFVISDAIIERIGKRLEGFDQLNSETIIRVFLLITNFQSEFEMELTSQCKRSMKSFNHVYESKIKYELEKLFQNLLQNQYTELDQESIQIGAGLLSASIYGASVNWSHSSSLNAEEYIRRAIPFISGMYLNNE
ncbi:TetR/AcrR family transcriptional regulator [Paenibacillus sp. FSL K6-0108]|uniref:TetR/AcrR family transcriptional regulator n=1 Tax=Paenibacillus sp. FSL K6-0108 TaxID=2921417 RepID=UPI00324DDC1C